MCVVPFSPSEPPPNPPSVSQSVKITLPHWRVCAKESLSLSLSLSLAADARADRSLLDTMFSVCGRERREEEEEVVVVVVSLFYLCGYRMNDSQDGRAFCRAASHGWRQQPWGGERREEEERGGGERRRRREEGYHHHHHQQQQQQQQQSTSCITWCLIDPLLREMLLFSLSLLPGRSGWRGQVLEHRCVLLKGTSARLLTGVVCDLTSPLCISRC